MSGAVLVQANHHAPGRFAKNNADILVGETDDDVFSLAGSSQRTEILAQTLTAAPCSCTLDTVANALNRPTVLNGDTGQQMVFCPGKGEVKVWRKIEG